MLIESRKLTCRGKQIQEATVQKYLTVASAVLSDAKRNEIISKNPAHMVELPPVESPKQAIPTSAQAELLIAAYAKERDARPADHLFTAPSGALIHPDTFTKRLKRLYARIGLPERFHLHTLRHYYVTVLLHHGVDNRTVANLVGHSDTSFLERVYCHPQFESKEQTAKILGESVMRRNGS